MIYDLRPGEENMDYLKPKHREWLDQIDKIAAAPYLLAACEETLAALKELAELQDIGNRGREAIDYLVHAIAKARIED